MTRQRELMGLGGKQPICIGQLRALHCLIRHFRCRQQKQCRCPSYCKHFNSSITAPSKNAAFRAKNANLMPRVSTYISDKQTPTNPIYANTYPTPHVSNKTHSYAHMRTRIALILSVFLFKEGWDIKKEKEATGMHTESLVSKLLIKDGATTYSSAA